MPAIEEIANSRARLTIASLISSRPRTLGELAEETGISVQGVLKHLKKLSEAGMLKVKNIPAGRYLRPRKLYFIDTRRVADYSRGEMIVATLGDEMEGSTSTEPTAPASDPYAELDRLAQDIILLRRRARELSIRMKRMTEEVTENESRIARLIEGLSLSPEEKQIAYLIFGDDRPEQARRILKEHYGCHNPEAAILDVVEKIRGSGA
ncbi:MAG: helix-turn-helix domain-containing protein [Thaumarchaeota archaeon]|nr:helix-turn-helix domain-containing protein [Nitrososphaerota archaeon]